MKYIEELGEGWDKIIGEHKSHPLKPKIPSIKDIDGAVIVNMFSVKDKFEKEEKIELTRRQKKILNYLRQNTRITNSSCAKLLKVSNDTSLRELSKLKSFGIYIISLIELHFVANYLSTQFSTEVTQSTELCIIKQKGTGRGIYYVIQ